MSEDIFSELPEEVAESWKIHTNAFGQILEPAFSEDIPTRIQLTAALNHISRRNSDRGIDILLKIEDSCIYDEDKCAWLFCMALAYEMSSNQEMAANYYYQCCQYSPDFYLPYLKIAKSAHSNQDFSLAGTFYQKTLQVISELDYSKDQQLTVVAASAASNLGSCYTMMHDYVNAEKMLGYSKAIMPSFPGRNGAYAILYAAAYGDLEASEKHLKLLKRENSPVYAVTEETVFQILKGIHPHFRVIEPKFEHLLHFWNDFSEKEALFKKELVCGNKEPICAYISGIMTKAFPCMQKKLRVRASKTDTGYLVELSDYYTVTLMQGYTELIEDMPSELKKHWTFTIVHD